MGGTDRVVQQLQIPLSESAIEWARLEELSQRERVLARELEQVRAQLHDQAREMKRAGLGSVAQIAARLARNRQRVNSWMHGRQPNAQDRDAHDPDWIDPEAHVPL